MITGSEPALAEDPKFLNHWPVSRHLEVLLEAKRDLRPSIFFRTTSLLDGNERVLTRAELA